jgi:small subunit ribosomal protein S3Ae
MTSNLMVLTGNMRKQEVNLTFRITKVLGDTAYTRVEKYAIAPTSIKRKVRRQKDRLDESFTCVTKDNKIIRIKPMIITAVHTSRYVKGTVRTRMVQHVMNTIRKMDYDSLVMEIINDKFQKDIAKTFSKIVPIRFVNIRVLQYMGEQKGAPVEETVEAEEPKGADEKPEKTEKAEPSDEPAVKEAAAEAPEAEPAPEVLKNPEDSQKETKPAEA